MRKVVIEDGSEIVALNTISNGTPIFAIQNGVFMGMVMRVDGEGWLLSLGGNSGATGFHETRESCMKSALNHGYDFFVE